mmetsp:Transcript_18119/g.36521  ORF Transcript_18119/g.36521 Transcript_18119/m.36521 type:complete len:215 (-) Transcript_18119:681-1325(-)
MSPHALDPPLIRSNEPQNLATAFSMRRGHSSPPGGELAKHASGSPKFHFDGMRLSMCTHCQSSASADHNRTVYSPVGELPSSRKSDSMSSGNSATAARAASSQQLPIAPCRRSSGAMSSNKRPLSSGAASWSERSQHSTSPMASSPTEQSSGGNSRSTKSRPSIGGGRGTSATQRTPCSDQLRTSRGVLPAPLSHERILLPLGSWSLTHHLLEW